MAREKSQKTKDSERELVGEDYSEKEARDRFERAVDIAVATKPVHRPAKQKAVRDRP